MSKSKSKSKSKSTSLTFPENYWSGEFDNYQYYDGFNKRYREIVGLPLRSPTLEGDQLRAEIEELLKKQENRKERKRRKEAILREIDDFNSEYAKALLIGPDSHPHVFQLMNAMSEFALIPIMHFKRKFMRPRPIQVEPRIDPMIPVPGHPSYPSGHSTQNFLIAHALSEVIGDDAQMIARVFEIARNIAQNREWAGLHYSSDTKAGENLARLLFPIMREVFGELIKEAAAEYQEIDLGDQDPVADHARAAERRAAKPVRLRGVELEAALNKTLFNEQWNLHNKGDAEGTKGSTSTGSVPGGGWRRPRMQIRKFVWSCSI